MPPQRTGRKTSTTKSIQTSKTSATKPPKNPNTRATKRSKKTKTLQPEGVDTDQPTASLPLYLERLLDQLNKAVGQGTGPSDEAGEQPISVDLLLTANRVGNSELRLRPEHLGKLKGSILKERTEKAIKETLSNKPVANPYADIRGYVRKARLPPLSWCLEASRAELVRDARTKGTGGASTSVNTFATTGTFAQPQRPGQTTQRKPDCVRKLRHIERIPYDEFLSRVQKFSDTLPVGFQPAPEGVASMQPGFWDGDQLHDEFLSLQAGDFDVRKLTIKPPEAEQRVTDWVEAFPAMTAARVLHVSDPETLGWAYLPVTGEKTMGMLSDLCWQRVPPGNTGVKGETIRRLVLEVKAPWVLDLELFNAFVNTSKIPTSDEIRRAKGAGSHSPNVDWTTMRDNPHDETSEPMEQPSIRFSKVENIWAQIYDYCVIQGNFFFILTTYDYWAFGVFSADYTAAQVTDPLPYDLSEPNILECLLYWTQSARLVPGMFEIPLVSDSFEPPRDQVHALKDAALLNLRAAKAVVSPLISEIKTTDDRWVIEICIKNTALHLRRIFQNEKNRAKITPDNGVKIQPSDKIQPKPDPPYAVACRFAASLGYNLTETIRQKDYEEQWSGYFAGGLRLQSDSQRDYDGNAELLAQVVTNWKALGRDELWEAHRNDWGAIDSALRYGSAPDGHGPESSAPVRNHAAPQVSHDSALASHGSDVLAPTPDLQNLLGRTNLSVLSTESCGGFGMEPFYHQEMSVRPFDVPTGGMSVDPPTAAHI
ncbi:hypothetical protein FRC01_007212 [Tulasnella sp. 417]|nr:hypothetical protein FRC01_007212 [Tulasnella sp. 417]